MSDELTKLAKLANNAAGDYKPNSLTAAMSPQNFGKYGGGPVMGRDGPMIGPLKDVEKAMGRIKAADMGPNYNSKLDSIKEENSASYNNMNSVVADIKREDFIIKKDGAGLKEENGGVFHENTDHQLDMKNLPVSEKMRSSPNWGNKQPDGHLGMMGREINRIDGSQYQHMPMQYPQHYTTGPGPTPQSHIFSTLIANQAAKAVYTGQTNSIITFHQSLTAKRKFLDPEQDITLDAPINNPPSATQALPQGDGSSSARHDNGPKPAAIDSTSTPANGTNGQKDESNGPASNKSNPKTPQGNTEQPPRPPTAPESVPTTTTTTKKTGAKRGKRKRSQSTTQPLHPTMPSVAAAPNMAMQQGMPPSGPSFAPFPRGSFGGGPFPPQSPQMRPSGMPPAPQGGGLGPSTTETENLDPSALWENPPSNKRRQVMSTMAPSWQQQQQQEIAMANHQAMPPMRPEAMMSQRQAAFMARQHHDQFQMPGGPPYDMAGGFSPNQPMDSLTPEQMRHREERLRQIKEMQKMLFPEDHQATGASPAPGGMLSPHGPMPDGGPPMMGPTGNMMSPSMMPGGPGHPVMGPGHPMMAMRGMSPVEQQRFMMSQQSMPPPLPQDFETMTPEQKAWVKLQQEFYMEKQRKMMDEQHKMQQSHMMDFPGRGPPMRFGPPMPGPGPFPPGDPMGQTMPPPPPYPATAASILQRRASMSGSFSPGAGGPPGSFGPMSPHAMSATQPPAARLARSNSLPSAQMPMGPGGSMPMQGSLSPESSQIRAQFRASTPTPASLTAGGSTAGMNPGSTGGPMSAPAMTSNSPGMSMGAQGCDTMVHTPGSMVVHSPHPSHPGSTQGNMTVPSPHPNHATTTSGNMAAVHSPHPSHSGANPGNMMVNSPHPSQPVTNSGNMVVHSPHPNQPGTPVMDQGIMPTSGPANMRQGTPNTPSPAVSIAKQAMVTSGNQRCSPKSIVEHKGPSAENTPTTSNGEARKTGAPTSGDMPAGQQKLVNFPPSQLNRDKAPNFPPRGEDLQQYSTTFYQKTKDQPTPGGSNGPNRLPHQFGQINADIMAASSGGNAAMPTSSDGMPAGIGGPATTIANRMAKAAQSNMMTSQSNMAPQPSMTTSQPNVMTSQQHLTSRPNLMTSQPTSQAAMMAPQSNMSLPRTTQPRAIAPAAPRMTSQPSMSSHSNMMLSQSGMVTSHSNPMTSQPNMMPSQPNMMSSQPNMMPSSQPGMLTSQHSMMASSQQSRMMSSPMHLPQHMSQPGNMMPGTMMGNQVPTPEMMAAGSMLEAERVMMSPRMMAPRGGPISSNGPMMSPGMRMPGPMMDHMMGGPQGRSMMAHPDMVMHQQQHKMMPTNMGPPMDGMAHGPMDMVPGNMRIHKSAMMDGMMVTEGGMEPVMEHPMSRQMMAGPGMRQPQPSSPLSLLQTRFSPPLPPDGKGPTKTLQYFPPGATQVQGQGGNPHLNPTPNQPSPGPTQGPKQIQMPFPMEMITSGPTGNPSALGPHRMQGMPPGGMRMMQGELMYHGDYGPRGPSPVAYMGPRPGMYGPMQHVGHPSRMPAGMMGPMQVSNYMDPGFGPQMMGGHPMGPGYNMPR